MKNTKETELAPGEKKPKEKLTFEDLIEDRSEENVRKYVEDLFAEIEEEIPRVSAVLEARPGLNRREGLMKLIRDSLIIRLEGVGKWYIATDKEIKASMRKLILDHIDFMEMIDKVLKEESEE